METGWLFPPAAWTALAAASENPAAAIRIPTSRKIRIFILSVSGLTNRRSIFG
jgi:hypothetical protein